jgi:hypothetical protein
MKYELVEANNQWGVRRITPMGSVFMFRFDNGPLNGWLISPELQVEHCYTADRAKAEDVFAKLEPTVIATKETA